MGINKLFRMHTCPDSLYYEIHTGVYAGGQKQIEYITKWHEQAFSGGGGGGFRKFLVTPALISNLNVHKNVGLSHVIDVFLRRHGSGRSSLY